MSFPSEQDRFLHEQEHHGNLQPMRPNFKEDPGSDIPIVTSTPRGIGFWTPFCIVGGNLAAALLGVLHYCLRLLDTGKSSQIEILLANAFKILFCFSAGVSLVQVSWRIMQRQPLPLADLNALMDTPSLLTLPRMNLVIQAPMTLAIMAVILASPLITVFAPSLSVRTAKASTQTLTVPTLDLTTDRVLDDIIERQGNHYGSVTNTWDSAAVIALLSESPVGWPIPEGCEPECQYNITYSAPAIQCTDLQPNQIDDGEPDSDRAVSRVFQDPPAAYLFGYDSVRSQLQKTALNFSTVDRFHDLTFGDADPNVMTDQYVWTLAFVPFLAANENEGTLINATGSVCVFYNATHQAQTHFFNDTQETTVSVVEYQEALNTTFKGASYALYSENGDGEGAAAGVPGVTMRRELVLMSTPWLCRNPDEGEFLNNQTRITETNLFQPLDRSYYGLIFPGMNVSTSVTNVSVGFIRFATGNTTVEVEVSSTENVYVFNRATLGATYLVSWGILLLITIAGMVALFLNGEPRANNFSTLLAATRNPRLHPISEAIKADPNLKADAARARLVFGEVVMPHGRVEPGFEVVNAESVENLRRRR
ncbi:hypothetical protein K438DRAFT_2111765 [Mycena galopus ATCC 62051]|nr:hypothetical protein K438DRAFT_2111765 [Mycena galopus ATCC 62051]